MRYKLLLDGFWWKKKYRETKRKKIKNVRGNQNLIDFDFDSNRLK